MALKREPRAPKPEEEDYMTPRDWFALGALAGFLADPGVDFGLLPAACYRVADEMLAERERQG